MKPGRVIALTVAFLILLYFALLLWLFPLAQVRYSGEIEVEELRGRAEIIRDRDGIVHIVADDLLSLFFAQGYVHCQERLFQMDLSRRLTSGRLSLLLGSKALSFDRSSFRLLLPEVAVTNLRNLFPEEKRILQAYADGVNACMRRTRLPFEYRLLLKKPERWSPVDTLHVTTVLAWALSGNFMEELVRITFLKKRRELFEKEIWALLDPPFSPSSPFILSKAATVLNLHREITRFLRAFPGGSNNWVLAPSRTTTGSAILANDPHLGVSLPGIWMLMHLKAGDYDVIGVSLPGSPGIVIGRNRRIAWGFTNSFADCQDIFEVETEGNSYIKPDGTRGEIEEKVYRIGADGKEEEIRVRTTEMGPFIGKNLVLAWTGYIPGHLIKAVIELNKAENWEEFRKALSFWTVPSQNAVYADAEGNIGYQLAGLIPKREGWTGLYPVKLKEVKGWTGFYTIDELPHVFNPPEGFIITANNAIDSQMPIALDVFMGYRAERLREMVLKKGRLSLEDVKRMQLDVHSKFAQRLCPLIISKLDGRLPIPYQKELDKLKGWDYNMSASSQEAALFELLVYQIQKNLFFPDDPQLQKLYIGMPPEEGIGFTLFQLKSREAIIKLLEKGNNYYINLLSGGKYISIEEMLREAFIKAVKMRGSRSWGEIHRIKLKHPLSQIGLLDFLLGPFVNVGTFPYGGAFETPCQAAFLPDGSFDVKVVPSYRQIIDFSKSGRSLWITYPGQSGRPSSFYRNLFEKWYRGEYLEMSFAIPEGQKLILTGKK